MTNLTRLKTKGAPPRADDATDVIADNTRRDSGDLRPIQFRIPAAVFEDFSKRAGEEFGYRKGAKSELFLRMWEQYRTS